jgi:hypothetical protein
MPGQSRSKNGVASLAYAPGIQVFATRFDPKTWMAETSPTMTSIPAAVLLLVTPRPSRRAA